MQGPRPSPLPLIWHYFNISKHLLYGITWTFLNIYSVVTLYIDIHYIPTHYEFKRVHLYLKIFQWTFLTEYLYYSYENLSHFKIQPFCKKSKSSDFLSIIPKYHHLVKFKSVRLVTWWRFSSLINSLGILSRVVVFVSCALKCWVKKMFHTGDTLGFLQYAP